MSIKTGFSLDPSQNGHIWQNKDLDPNTTSIVVINRKFLLNDSEKAFNECIAKAEQETKCSICLHGQINKGEPIWIRIKSDSQEARRNAFKFIDEATNHSCNEIVLPKFVEEEPLSTIESPSPSPTPDINDSHLKSSNEFKHVSNNNFTFAIAENSTETNTCANKFPNDLTSTRNGSNIKNHAKKYEPKKLTRSSTENLISSFASTSPFGTVLSPLAPSSISSSTSSQMQKIQLAKQDEANHKINNGKSGTINTILEVNESNEHKNEIKVVDDSSSTLISSSSINANSNYNKYKLKYRYTVDFLLLRADTPNSKQMPSNWKELNKKYPLVCFCGKVLSYFDPYKYHEHWDKTKNQNPELHQSSYKFDYSSHTKGQKKIQTDDYLNLKSTHFKETSNHFNTKRTPNIDHKPYKRFEMNNNNSTDANSNNHYLRKQQQISFDQIRQSLNNTSHGMSISQIQSNFQQSEGYLHKKPFLSNKHNKIA